MNTAATLDKQINNYLGVLNTRQKKALLTVAKTFAEEQPENNYADEFKAELDSRYEEYKNGGKLICEAEVNKSIRKIIKSRKWAFPLPINPEPKPNTN